MNNLRDQKERRKEGRKEGTNDRREEGRIGRRERGSEGEGGAETYLLGGHCA